MEVRKDYKQTEVGIIPEEWEVRPLLETVRIANGQVDPKTEPYKSMVLVAPDHVESRTGKLIEQRTAEEQRAISGKYLFQSGDIVYSKIRPYLRKAILADFQGLCSADMYPLTPAKDISPYFIFSILLDNRFSVFAETVSVRSGIPKINRDELSEFRLAVPPFPEQQAIATALSDVNALLNSLDALIAKKRLIKQGAKQELLTGKKRLPGFDGEWEEKKLGELAVLSKAGINPASSPETLFAHFSLPAFDAGAVPIIEKGSQIGSNKFLVPDNAVLISKLNPRIPRIWAPTSVPENAICSTEFLVLTPREDINRNFLAVLCSSPAVSSQMELHAIGTTGSHQRIHPSQVLAIEVNVPKDKEEQTAIAEILSDMDAEISALEQKREKTRLLKQGMMQELLTGRIRLL